MTTLHVIGGPDIGRSFQIEKEEIYIGRSPENEVQIKDRFVSRKHLKIRKKDRRYYLQDLESKNGTFVDGNWIRPGSEVGVEEGTPVVMGMSVICLGNTCSEDILSVLDAVARPGLESEPDEPVQDRPMTTQKNMELLRKISEVFTQSLNVNEILNRILDHIFDFFKRIDRGAIILVDPETGEISEVVSRAREGARKGTERYCTDVVEQVIEEGKGIMIRDALVDSEREIPDTLKLHKIKSVMCVPLISKSRVRGVLYVDCVTEAGGFRKEDLSLFKAMGIPAANAIENAMLYARRRMKEAEGVNL
ncbi:MAG: FHA domain-containing protein [Deltaproteobacteria bacterium]|nr:FHA domain-containing protein [Deltaproteobacteria bacterium]